MAFYGSNYPTNSGPPPPGMAGGAYGNFGGYGQQQQQQYSAYNNPGMAGAQMMGGMMGGMGAMMGGMMGGMGGMMGGMGGMMGGMGGQMGGMGGQMGGGMMGGYQQPAGMAPPQSTMYNQSNMMQNQMASQNMQMQNMQQLGYIQQDEEDLVEMRKAKKRARRRRLQMEEEEEEECDEEAEKAAMEARLAKAEARARELQEKLENDDSAQEQLRCCYIDELMRRQDISGTFEVTQGTIAPMDYYYADDLVAQWWESEKQHVIYRTDADDESGDNETGKWDAEYDIEYMRKAIRGWGTDETAIVYVSSTRSNAQRNQIYQQYKTAYGRDLIEDIRGDTSGDFRDCLLGLYEKPALYDAYEIKKAIYGLGTDEATLIEILFTRTNAQIKEMVDNYNNITYSKRGKPEQSLEEDIEGDCSGDFKKLLISAATGGRKVKTKSDLEKAVQPVMHNDKFTGMFQLDPSKMCNMSRCKGMAKELMEAGEERWGTDEEVFNRVFSTQDFFSLRVIYDQYVKLSQRDIMNSVERETSGDYKRGLLAVVQTIKCRPLFFAQKLYKSMKGLGTNDSDLIRIVVSRSELDMIQIKACFLEQYKQTLWNFIKDDTSGDYKDLLLAIVGKD